MSNEKLEYYKSLYSEYLEHAVNLHNYHHLFLRRGGQRPARAFSQAIKAMIKLERKLWRASVAAYYENLENFRIEKKRKKEELKAWKAANKGKPGRPKGKKHGHNNSTTSKTI